LRNREAATLDELKDRSDFHCRETFGGGVLMEQDRQLDPFGFGHAASDTEALPWNGL